MHSQPLVAVIIVHWGSPTVTMECMATIRSSNYENLHIIVVDNCSRQRLWRDPSKLDREVTYLQSETNLGYAGGNNVGIGKALELKAKYILLLNNDTVVDNDMIIHCVTYLEGHPDVSLISPKILHYSAPQYINVAGGGMDVNTGYSIRFGENEEDFGQFDSEQDITWATGCALFAASSVFEHVGLFDESLFSYCEDDDLSRRILLAGMRMKYYPKAKVWHKGSSVKVNHKISLPTSVATYYFWRNRLYNLRRYISGKRAKGYGLFAFRFLWTFASFALKHQRLDLCLAMLLGVGDSIAGRMGKREYSIFGARTARVGE